MNLTDIFVNPPIFQLSPIGFTYNLIFLLIALVAPIAGVILRREYYWSISALILILITLSWKKTWNWWLKGLYAFIAFIAGLLGYHLTPLQVITCFSAPSLIILSYGLYSSHRSNIVVKVVGRLKFLKGQPTLLWYGLKGKLPLLQTKTVKDLFRRKANRNIYICGSSGSGKTYASNSLLTRAFHNFPILALSFKLGDSTLNLQNFTVIDVSKTPINAFEDEDAFIRSFLITFFAEKIGMMYSGVPSILREALRNVRSWNDLIRNLETLANATEDSLRRSTIDWILNNIMWSLKPKIDTTNGWIWDFKSNVVLDFSNLNEDQKTFFAELILNLIWKRLQKERKPCVIFIDEAHRILGRKTIYRSVLNEMAREIRSLKGILIIASQNLTDIDKDLLNQFDTQFVFHTTNKEDIEAIKAINPYLADIVTELPPHICVDLKQRRKDVEFYKFLPPKYKKEERKLESEVKPAESLDKTPSVVKTAGKTETSGKTAYVPDPEFDAKVERAMLEYLMKWGIGYVTRMAKDLSPIVGKDASRLKADINRIFKRLVAQGIVSKSDFINENGTRIVYYWLKEKGESPFHRILVNSTCKLLMASGITYELPGEGPDIIAYPDIRIVAIECETGLKDDLNAYKEQVLKRFKQGFDEVWAICPTPDVADRYRALNIPNHRVFTLQELKRYLKKVKLEP